MPVSLARYILFLITAVTAVTSYMKEDHVLIQNLHSKTFIIITSAALPTIGNKKNPTNVLLNPEDSTIPSIEPTKYLAENAVTIGADNNKINDTLRDNLGSSSA
jgi:hypothetical protein